MQLLKLRLALDSETTAHANLIASLANLTDIPKKSERNASLTNVSSLGIDVVQLQMSSSADSTPVKSKENVLAETRKAFLIGESEKRVQALSVIMLYLCTGLQYAQGVTTN